MKNLFNTEETSEIKTRIGKISSGTKPIWGKMNASQMLAHCSVGLSSALGDVKQKRKFMGLLFGKMAKKSIFNPKPWKKGLPTDKSFLITDRRDFDKEKSNFMSLLERFNAAGPGGMSSDPHPFFGDMTGEEWGILQYRHIDHHFSQFGA
jgi:uncharacterized protein DUF1569